MSEQQRAINVPYVEGKENVSELSLSQLFTLKLETDRYFRRYVLTMVREADLYPVTDAPLIELEGNNEPPIELECANLRFRTDVQAGARVQVYAILFTDTIRFLRGNTYTVVP